MAEFVFKLPDIGEGVVEGEIVTWHVKPGDAVVEDQPLCDVMTDKATVTIPSTVHGRVIRTTGKPGDRVPVGRELIVFDLSGDAPSEHPHSGNGSGSSHASTAGPAAPTAPAPIVPTKPASAAPSRAASSPPGSDAMSATSGMVTLTSGAPPGGGRALASPALRRRAKERGVDLRGVPGTGPGGRVTAQDLEAFVAGGGAGSGSAGRRKRTGKRAIQVIGLRRRIAERMQLSKRSIPHFSYLEEIDITELSDLRDHLNEIRRPEQPRLTYLPLVLMAVTRALERHGDCNAWYDEASNTITEHEAIHLGIAAQTDKGLMVPVIRHAESLDLFGIASELKRVSDAARNGTAKLEELTGSTFTVTSLGKLGGLSATPIINHPEVGILGAHKAQERAMVHRGSIAIRMMMNVSVSFDHRIIDGARAAEFVQEVKGLLEHPATMFL